ncbi:MAG: hypothetical protein ABIB41_08615, partial [Nitrospirota bacterium]
RFNSFCRIMIMSFPAILPPSKNRQYSTSQSGHFHFALIGHYHFAVTGLYMGDFPECLAELLSNSI